MSEKVIVICAFENCQKQGDTLACGKQFTNGTGHPTPALYCAAHASVVADEGCPEYHDTCPNCGCLFGVN